MAKYLQYRRVPADSRSMVNVAQVSVMARIVENPEEPLDPDGLIQAHSVTTVPLAGDPDTYGWRALDPGALRLMLENAHSTTGSGQEG